MAELTPSAPASSEDGPVGRILLTGATGYIGGRLLRLLEERGQPLRCLGRRPEELQAKVSAATEVHYGDVADRASLEAALQQVDTAYYLIHSMGAGPEFEQQDRLGAQNFAAAAKAAGVRRIIYLGGLAHGEGLSAHMRSRHEVGALLKESGIPVIELRASIVIGSGSLSFEMIRALVERLPVMVMPRWVVAEAQPIAVEDLLDYLLAVLDADYSESRIFEIGGADRVSYRDLMSEYARQRGLRRRMLRVPVLTPRLSSLWLGLVTPVYARIGAKLIDSIRHASVVEDDTALREFDLRPQGMPAAIAAALRNEDHEFAESRWSDAFSSSGATRTWGGTRFGNRLVDSRERVVDVSPARAFAPIQRIGGETGWYALNWLWKLRGFLDLLVGGVGMRRGRKHPREVQVGDAIDFWRVEAIAPDSRLRLRAEMKLPGRAWLEFEVEPRGEGSVIRQTATFDPVGLAGLSYWFLVYPLHVVVFSRMLRRLAVAAEAIPASETAR